MNGYLIEFDDTVVDSDGNYHKLEDYIEQHSQPAPVDKPVSEDVIGEEWRDGIYYNVGEYVIYNNALYKCLVTNISVEPTDATYWLLTSVTCELISQNEEIAEQGTEITRLDTDLGNTKDSVSRKASIINMSGLTDGWSVDNFPNNFFRKPILFVGAAQNGITYIASIYAHGTTVRISDVLNMSGATISLNNNTLTITISTTNMWGVGMLIY